MVYLVLEIQVFILDLHVIQILLHLIDFNVEVPDRV